MNRLLCFTFLIVLVFINPAFARDKVLDIKEVTSPGGIKAWLVEDHSVPVISLQFAFQGAGAVQNPPEKQGLAQLASNTLDEGAGELDSQTFQKALQDLSIELRFKSGRDEFIGTLKTLSKNKARAFELMHLALTEPRFDEDPVARMRAANQSRIRSSLSDPGWLAARILNDKAYEGHPYALNSGGTLSSLEAITSDDLHNFVETRLGKNNLLVAASGDITEEELAQILDQIFGSLPNVDLPAAQDIELQNQGKTFLYKHDIPQTMIEITQPGIARSDPDFFPTQVLNFILGGSGFGSRLTEEVREKRGLTYGIYTRLINLDHVNTFGVSTSTANENTKEVLDIIKAEWEEMASTPISEQELQDAKSYLIGSLPLSLTSTDKISGLLLTIMTEGQPIDYLDKREAGIKNTSIEDIQNLSKKLLDADKFMTVLVGQPENIEGAEIIETLPNVK